MQFRREVNRLLAGLLIAFALVTAAAAYWAVTGADTILQRDDNGRRVLAEQAILRGGIYDRRGEPLVLSWTADPLSDTVQRTYLQPETYSALGYFSDRYGTGGIEAVYDATLRGADLPQPISDALTRQLLHRPTQGSDVQITLDSGVQEQVIATMRGERGAVIVISIPEGDVLAMISLPSFDPNLLDVQWETLVSAPDSPLFNRALQGQYQPGAALQTPLMAAALLVDEPIDDPLQNATSPVTIADLRLDCAVRLPSLALSLREAYAFACPAAFAGLAERLSVGAVQATFDTFRLEQTPTLDGFAALPPPDSTPIVTPTSMLLNNSNFLSSALGQGTQTVTPLTMAMIASAVVNDGNTPQPTVLIAVRPPESDAWVDATTTRPTIPITTSATARQLQDLMRGAVANGAAQNAGRPDIDIGGHAALAYSGDGSLAWFIGFATFGGSDGAAVAVVLENSADTGRAADIGGTALQAARNALAERTD